MWDNEGDDVGTTFRDMITLALAGFLCMLIILLTQIGKKKETVEEGKPPPGNVVIEARWDDKLAADVDLWVKAPGDVPVGYSNKSGLIFNLLRDDLGTYADPLDLNYETSFTRGIPPGEYVVNAHMYRNTSLKYPVRVRLTASCKTGDNEPVARLVSREVELLFEGQEVTVFRFRIDENCKLDQDSVSAIFKPLRALGKGNEE